MRFRDLLFAFPVLAVAGAPATAQDIVFVSGTGEPVPIQAIENDFAPAADEGDADFGGMAEKMSDPAVQDGVAATIESATGAMMNLPVGPLAKAIERARPGTVDRNLPRDARLGDLAGRNTEYLPQELGDRSREAMGMMSGFARAMAVMMPEFERIGREMEESFRAAKAETRRNRN